MSGLTQAAEIAYLRQQIEDLRAELRRPAGMTREQMLAALGRIVGPGRHERSGEPCKSLQGTKESQPEAVPADPSNHQRENR